MPHTVSVSYIFKDLPTPQSDYHYYCFRERVYSFIMLTNQCYENLFARSYMPFSLPIYTTGTDYKIQISAKKKIQNKHDTTKQPAISCIGSEDSIATAP